MFFELVGVRNREVIIWGDVIEEWVYCYIEEGYKNDDFVVYVIFECGIKLSYWIDIY